MVDPNTRQGKRAPVTLKIKFKSATLEQFIERYAVDVSHGGIFIRTKEPLAVGTQMRFEFQLRDATPLITGEGTVVWTRENDPARPGVAPGMGVRFDRLHEGSQQVLDRILAEKAKGIGTHAPSDTKPPIFNEAPTKVAPSPLVGALKDETKPKIGQMAPPRAGFGDERTDATPLPKPMPFHSDADEFPDEAFEEATKVRSLDDLVAATKEGGAAQVKAAAKAAELMDDKATTRLPQQSTAPVAAPIAAPVAAPVPVAAPTPVAPPSPAATTPLKDELAERRAAKMADPEPEPAPESVRARTPTPPAPMGARDPGLLGDPSAHVPSMPSLREPAFVQAKAEARLDAKAAKAKADLARPATPIPSKPKAAAAADEPVREAPRGAPVGLLLLLLVVVGGAAAFWFFYLRDRNDKGAGGGSAVASDSGSGSGSAVASDNGPGSAVASGSGAGSTGSGAVASGSAGTGSGGSGAASGSASTGSGGSAATGSGSASAAPEMADVTITSPTKNATVDIADAGVNGAPLPYKGKLEKGKTVTAHVSAPGHVAQDVQLVAGKPLDVKLKSMPHVVHVTSQPGGAMIFVDGQPTRRTTPGDVDLTAGQADQGVRIEVRKAGFDRAVATVKAAAFTEDGDTLSASIAITMVAARVVVNNGGGTQIRHPGSGSASTGSGGSASSGGSGSASGSGSAASGATGGSGSGAAGSTGSGSATPSTGSGGSSGSGSAVVPTGSGSASGGAGSASTGGGEGSAKGSGEGSAKGSGASGSGSGSGTAEPTPDWMK